MIRTDLYYTAFIYTKCCKLQCRSNRETRITTIKKNAQHSIRRVEEEEEEEEGEPTVKILMKRECIALIRFNGFVLFVQYYTRLSTCTVHTHLYERILYIYTCICERL